jgi:hypothetical protein
MFPHCPRRVADAPFVCFNTIVRSQHTIHYIKETLHSAISTRIPTSHSHYLQLRQQSKGTQHKMTSISVIGRPLGTYRFKVSSENRECKTLFLQSLGHSMLMVDR